MTVFLKEIKQSLKSFLIWTGAITFMLVICVALFPEMKGQMDGVTDMFANMGGFTAAFGMDKLNFGTLIGYYGIECGNVLGIGGGFFAAYIGISMLSKEEKEHTAEFLLTHPMSRLQVVFQKLLAVAAQIIVMNLVITLLSAVSILAIGETLPTEEFLLLHTAYLLMQLEVGLLCFGLSAFLHGSSIGIGLGAAALLYFMNLLCNISEQAKFLEYLTPFAYTESADIVTDGALRGDLIVLGCIKVILVVAAGMMYYKKKDMRA